MKRSIFEKIFLWVRLLVTAIATLAIFNYPRTWWQELICATSLVWGTGIFLAVCFDIARFRRISWTLPRTMLVLLQILCVARTGQVVMPYLYAKRKPYPQLVYSSPARFLFIDISARKGNVHADALAAFIQVEDPSVVILTRYADTSILEGVADRFPYRVFSGSAETRVVEIFSKLKIQEPVRRDYGYAALPAVAGEFLTPEGNPLVIGAFDALPPYNQEDFVRSRLTSRRLASFFKYATKPQIVLGAFRTSVTSQIVSMYPSQLGLRALSFDSGISIIPDLLRQSFTFDTALHVFTARRIEISRVIESRADDGGFSAILFDARIPRERGDSERK